VEWNGGEGVVNWLDKMEELDPAYHSYPELTPEMLCCGGDLWFDRGLCAQPCNSMHTRCAGCGRALDGCPYEQGML
jgi:hypothetical protein